jgi:hypothetical protein
MHPGQMFGRSSLFSQGMQPPGGGFQRPQFGGMGQMPGAGQMGQQMPQMPMPQQMQNPNASLIQQFLAQRQQQMGDWRGQTLSAPAPASSTAPIRQPVSPAGGAPLTGPPQRPTAAVPPDPAAQTQQAAAAAPSPLVRWFGPMGYGQQRNSMMAPGNQAPGPGWSRTY